MVVPFDTRRPNTTLDMSRSHVRETLPLQWYEVEVLAAGLLLPAPALEWK